MTRQPAGSIALEVQKKAILTRAKRIVVKVGSAVLTNEDGLDLRVISRLADQLSSLHDKGLEVILVSSGAVAAGRRAIPSASKDKCLPVRQAFSAVGQSRLMQFYNEAFDQFKKVTAQVLLTRDDLKVRERFLNARNAFATLLEWRVIPIVNENDTVAVQELKFGDNDTLASLLLNLVEADLFVNMTSADGVYDGNPNLNPKAKVLQCIEDIAGLDLEKMCEGKTVEGTGGMYSKLLSARRAAQIGVPTVIVSGKIPFALEKLFAGEDIGTWILAGDKAISRRKFWLAYNLDPAGRIVVDAGAAKALLKGGKSLLPAGIVDVEGGFGVGALVRIVDAAGASVGVGLSNYKAAELKKIMGHKTSDIEHMLGHCSFPEAVHRDNLLLDPAI